MLNDSVTDLSDEDNEAGGSVVVLGVVPDKQNGVHDGHKLVSNLGQLLRGVTKVVEQVLKSLEVLEVFIGLFLSDLNLLLQLGEGSCVGALVLFEELKDLLDAFRVELHTDAVEVLGLVLPELDLSRG